MTSVRPLALVDAHPFLQLQGDIVELGPVLQDLVVLGTVRLEDFDGGACAALQSNTIFLLLLCYGSLPGLLQVLLARVRSEVIVLTAARSLQLILTKGGMLPDGRLLLILQRHPQVLIKHALRRLLLHLLLLEHVVLLVFGCPLLVLLPLAGPLAAHLAVHQVVHESLTSIEVRS